MSIIEKNFITLSNGAHVVTFKKEHTDALITDTLRYLCERPEVNVQYMHFIGCTRLSSEQSVLLGRFLARNRTLRALGVGRGVYTRYTLMKVTEALRHNSTLIELFVGDTDWVPDKAIIEEMLTEALRVGPDRPAMSHWYLFSHRHHDGRLYDSLPVLLEDAEK